MKLIIYINVGPPNIAGHHKLEFKWSQAHGCHIYLGRELTPEEFNKHAADAFGPRYQDFYRDSFYPGVRIVGMEVPSAPLGLEPDEVTLDEALEVVERMAPHRLRAKTGPKPKELVPV